MRKFTTLKTAMTVMLGSVILSTSCQEPKTEEEIAAEIHAKAFTVDTHTDTPMVMMRGSLDVGKDNSTTVKGSQVDFPRMKQGGLDAVFFAAFTSQRARTEANMLKAKAACDKMIDLVHESCEKYPELAEIATSVDDGYRIEKTGKRAIYIGIENGFPIGTELSEVERFYNKGARYITLSHSSNNDICDSSTDTLEHNGLSKFGYEVVKEMNRLGMIIDVSHISDKSFFDVIENTSVPVMASHSCARAICGHPRNMTDEMLLKLKENGGVMQLCILSDYIKTPDSTTTRAKIDKEYRARLSSDKFTDEEKKEIRKRWYALRADNPKKLATVSDAVDHIDHVVKLIGIDHIGIGTDFDGGGGLADCNSDADLPNITLELVKRGYSEEDIIKIWGGNLMRVFRAIEQGREACN